MREYCNDEESLTSINYSRNQSIFIAFYIKDGISPDQISSRVHALLNIRNGNGTFTGPTNFDPAGLVTGLGDFNNDGKTDVALVNPVSLLNGEGLGSFGPATSYGAGPSSSYLAAGDFNDDGKVDLAVADSHRHKVFILLNQLPGSPLNPIDNARTFHSSTVS